MFSAVTSAPTMASRHSSQEMARSKTTCACSARRRPTTRPGPRRAAEPGPSFCAEPSPSTFAVDLRRRRDRLPQMLGKDASGRNGHLGRRDPQGPGPGRAGTHATAPAASGGTRTVATTVRLSRFLPSVGAYHASVRPRRRTAAPAIARRRARNHGNHRPLPPVGSRFRLTLLRAAFGLPLSSTTPALSSMLDLENAALFVFPLLPLSSTTPALSSMLDLENPALFVFPLQATRV